MNWAQFKDPLCFLYLCGTVVSFLSLTQEIVGSNTAILLILKFLFVTELHLGKLDWGKFEDPVGYLCVGISVVRYSLTTQEVT